MAAALFYSLSEMQEGSSFFTSLALFVIVSFVHFNHSSRWRNVSFSLPGSLSVFGNRNGTQGMEHVSTCYTTEYTLSPCPLFIWLFFLLLLSYNSLHMSEYKSLIQVFLQISSPFLWVVFYLFLLISFETKHYFDEVQFIFFFFE